MNPPMTGPRTGPSSIGIPTTLITRPTRLGPAACVSRMIPTGMISPPPKPCSRRKPISMPVDWASPHRTEPPTNSATEDIHTRLASKRWLSQPASGITVASASR